MTLLITLILFVGIYGYTGAVNYRIAANTGQGEIAADVHVEGDHMLMSVGDVSKVKGYKSTINYQDFESGKTAYKIIADGVCYVSDSTETPEEVRKSVIEYKQTRRPHTLETLKGEPDEEVMTQEALELFAGKGITEFCKDYESYRMTFVPLEKPFQDLSQKRSLTRRGTQGSIIMAGPNTRFCLFACGNSCWWNCG